MKIILLLSLLIVPFAQAADCVPVTENQTARLYRCENLHILYLHGHPRERAKAAGELLRHGHLSPAVMDYFTNKLRDMVKQTQPAFVEVARVAYNQIVRLLHRALPVQFAEEIDSMAEGMGVDPIDLRRALSLPDSAALVNVLGSHRMFRWLPASGCTSVAWRRADGTLFYGRNLDFAGAGVWDAHPMVTVVLPKDSRELKHVVFGADGAIFGGITGVNEAGISFAVHQNYSRDGGLRGHPMIFLGERVLREARSLEDAFGILKKSRPAVMWTFVIANHRTGEVAAVESSPNHFAVRRMEGDKFVQTNHVMNAETRPAEFIPLGIKMNSIYRMKKAFELLTEVPADPIAGLARILSYQENPDGRLAAYYDILKAHTIQTILLSGPDAYVTVDPAPTSGGRFARLSLPALFNGEVPARLDATELTRFNAETRARQVDISRAFALYFDKHEPIAASEMLLGHATLDSALFRAVALTQAGRWGEALTTSEAALRNPRFLAEPTYIRQSLAWVKAVAFLELGRGSEAKQLATELLAQQPPNKRLRDFAERLQSGRPIPKHLRRFSFDFFSGDLHGREF